MEGEVSEVNRVEANVWGTLETPSRARVVSRLGSREHDADSARRLVARFHECYEVWGWAGAHKVPRIISIRARGLGCRGVSSVGVSR